MSNDKLACEIEPRPLLYPLSDYHRAAVDGPLHATWQDKPHRLLYDLIAAVRYYTSHEAERQAGPVAAESHAVVAGIVERIEAALQRIEDGHGIRRIPADPTDPDLVLAECKAFFEGRNAPFWVKPPVQNAAPPSPLAEQAGTAVKPPKHKFWGAGEADCPADLKAPNGELHSRRCKVCGETNPRDQYCWNAAPLKEQDKEDAADFHWLIDNRHKYVWHHVLHDDEKEGHESIYSAIRAARAKKGS